MNYKIYVFFLSGLMFISSFIMYSTNKIQNEIDKDKTNRESEIQGDSIQSSNLWNVNYIHVNNNWTITNETYPWCNGKGTESEPFIIENVNISGNGNVICILIENTREFFKIKNSIISNSEIGIRILNSTHVNISNTKIYNIIGNSNPPDTQPNVNIGIHITNCSDVFIWSNNLSQIRGGDGYNMWYSINGGHGDSAIGILLNKSNKIIITSNNISFVIGGKGANGDDGDVDYPESISGGTGGNGGSSIGLSLENLSNITITNNRIFNISTGNGGFAGNGGPGMDGPVAGIVGGDGGDGGDGGNGGNCHGIYLSAIKNISNFHNFVENITGGCGGDGGNGGDGGDGGDGIPGLGSAGSGGYGGDGGDGGDNSLSIAIFYENCTNNSMILNYIQKIVNQVAGIKGLGGYRGSPGMNGGGSYGYIGYDGLNGLYNNPNGLNFNNANNSLIYLNSIFCQINVDNGTNNQWDNGTLGNYWSFYQGTDENPCEGLGDTYYHIDGVSNSNDTKPIVNPLIYPKENDFDNDGLSNLEEFIFASDGYITNASNPDTDYDGLEDFWEWMNTTNPRNNDTDGDLFLDSVEVSFKTNALNKWWYPMPNLQVCYFKNTTILENNYIILDFSIQNNGIWKVENVVVIIICESEGLTLYNSSKTPFSLDVDQTIIVQNLSALIKTVGIYNLKITIDPLNSINETYSSKDGSFRLNNEYDNTLQATLTIIRSINKTSDIIYIEANDDDDSNNDIKEEKLFDEKTIITIAIVSIIWAVALIIVFTSLKIKSAKQKDLLNKKLRKSLKIS